VDEGVVGDAPMSGRKKRSSRLGAGLRRGVDKAPWVWCCGAGGSESGAAGFKREGSRTGKGRGVARSRESRRRRFAREKRGELERGRKNAKEGWGRRKKESANEHVTLGVQRDSRRGGKKKSVACFRRRKERGVEKGALVVTEKLSAIYREANQDQVGWFSKDKKKKKKRSPLPGRERRSWCGPGGKPRRKGKRKSLPFIRPLPRERGPPVLR